MLGIHGVASRIQHTLRLIRNQGVYNDRNRLDDKPYLNTNASQSRSGSVPEFGLGPSSTNYKYDLEKSKDGSNPDMDKKGFGS